MQRWAFAPQMGPVERARHRRYGRAALVPQAVSNVVEGKMTPQQAADWLQQRVEELVQDASAEAEIAPHLSPPSRLRRGGKTPFPCRCARGKGGEGGSEAHMLGLVQGRTLAQR